MKFLFVIGAVLILTPGNGWALECQVCDDGDIAYVSGDGGKYHTEFTDNGSENKYHLVEELCSENTPMTPCEENENVCVTYNIKYETKQFTKGYSYYYNYYVNLQQYRCGKEDDLTAHCQEYNSWHDEQYLKYKNEDADGNYYYKGADIKKCEPKITKKGKFINN